MTESPTNEELARLNRIVKTMPGVVRRSPLEHAIATIDALNARITDLERVVEAARNILANYPQAARHMERRIVTQGHPAGTCEWCGKKWPCDTARLHNALATLDHKEDQ